MHSKTVVHPHGSGMAATLESIGPWTLPQTSSKLPIDHLSHCRQSTIAVTHGVGHAAPSHDRQGDGHLELEEQQMLCVMQPIYRAVPQV